MKKQGVITQLFIVSVCWRKPGHVLGFVVPSTIKLFVLHLVRGDVLPQNNPGLSRAGNDNTCSSMQSAPYSDVKTSKIQEPRRTTGRNQVKSMAAFPSGCGPCCHDICHLMGEAVMMSHEGLLLCFEPMRELKKKEALWGVLLLGRRQRPGRSVAGFSKASGKLWASFQHS